MPAMIEVIWRYDPNLAPHEGRPHSPEAARNRLDAGSAGFAALGSSDNRQVLRLTPNALGMTEAPGQPIVQEPFAAVLGCSDARVPAELVFGQAANDLFVVRVAGNVPGAECLGSLDFAVENLPSVQLIAVVGHTGCGAVSAAVDAYVDPEAYFAITGKANLRAIIDSIMAAVTTAADAMKATFGDAVRERSDYREALIETTVVVNAALTASLLAQKARVARRSRPGIVFGLYNLAERSVGLPTAAGWQPGLADPPASAADLHMLARTAAGFALG